MTSLQFAALLTMVMTFLPPAVPSLSQLDDLLLPYKVQHGATRSIRRIREIQSPRYNYTYEIVKANTTDSHVPVSSTRYFVSNVPMYDYSPYTTVLAYGHITKVTNVLRSFSVLEPKEKGGCAANATKTVEYTAKKRKCLVAQNGGFFNTTSKQCLGNIVSDGRLVQNAGNIQNVNFGVTKNGSIVVGYLSDEDIEKLNFQQLVGGAIWLVRNGESYVEDAFKCESSEIEETGTLRTFIDVQSARTAIGHDALGQVVLVQVEGQTKQRGVNLDQFARLLIKEFHLVNAINLDGGGSAALVLNGTLASYPSDHCKSDPEWRCAREVTTIVCVHELDCVPDCVHGQCLNGKCVCDDNYRGATCDELYCAKHNCSQHGVCHPAGCDCELGFHGMDCTIPCKVGRYGKNCSQECRCENDGSCDSKTGECDCLSGFGGALCETGCELGSYGRNCEYRCHCGNSCLCDPVTGACDVSSLPQSEKDSPVLNVAQCIARKLSRTEEKKSDEKEYEKFRKIAILSAVVGALALSLALNLYFMLLNCDCVDGRMVDHRSRHRGDYIPLRDMNRERGQRSPRRRTKPFSMRSKKRSRHKSKITPFNKLVTGFKNSMKKPSRDGYTRLLLPESNIEFEETSLLEQFR